MTGFTSVLVLIKSPAYLLARFVHVLVELPVGLSRFYFGFIECDTGIVLHLFRCLVRLRTRPLGIGA